MKRGEQIRFVISNAGELDARIRAGDAPTDNLKHAEVMKKYPDMEHDDPERQDAAAARQESEIVWRFTKAASSNSAA